MRPTDAIQGRLDAVRMVIARYPVSNPHLFGSVARGEDRDGSDLDLLVDPLASTTLFDLAGLEIELAELLGVKVDVVTPAGLAPRITEAAGRDTRPL